MSSCSLCSLAGTLGYMLVEGWGPLDSLYMTVITVATVGFREVQPLSPQGQWFTIALIFAGVGGIAYSIGTIVDFMVEGHLVELLEGRRMAKRISELSGHYVVVGMGRVGSVVCRIARRARSARSSWSTGARSVSPSPTSTAGCTCRATRQTRRFSKTAGVKRAKGLVTALDTDADNLFVALSARGMNPALYIVARSSSLASESKILRSGADRVITPNVIGGRRMATSLLNPAVSDYLDIVTHSEELEYRLEALHIGESVGPSPAVHRRGAGEGRDGRIHPRDFERRVDGQQSVAAGRVLHGGRRAGRAWHTGAAETRSPALM